MKQLSKDEFFDMLQERVDEAGSQTALADQLEISNSYLNDVMRRRKQPGGKLLRSLNLREVITYVPEPDEKEEK